jgi:L-alanine-DL-glutamate epimerase-like enolase superfamily enzyme
MQLKHFPFTLQLKNTFTLATSSRTTTPSVIVEIENEHGIGYGEASLPPYIGETQELTSGFLSVVDICKYDDPMLMDEILNDIDMIADGHYAAKAAFDIALHDLVGKKIGFPWYRIWGLSCETIPYTSFTIGIDTIDKIREKVTAAQPFKILKVKLGHDKDKEIISTIRELTDVPIRVDVNQGWNNRDSALKMIEWLASRGVELVEQPLPVELVDDTAWLRERSPIPIIADESVRRLGDIRKLHGVFDGINIKLMKCGGMREAYKMIVLAKALEMKVMLGCMIETTCAISAAAQLSPMVDFVDLDGALLISNDIFNGAALIDGKIVPSENAGNGVGRR